MTERDFPTYAGLKEACQAALSRLGSLLDDDGSRESLQQRMTFTAEKLAHDRFHLAVLGQFKRGKTTFINSLLGADILPTGIVPLTSIVTLIEYGTEAAAMVRFQDGTPCRISIKDVAAYVTERGNPRNTKQVSRVEVTYPAAILRDGVVLIDTPGIGSTYDHNTDVTYKFLPQVDAAIFVASVDPPLSRAERDFLAAIRQYAAKLFFVLNKIDYVDERERDELLEFLRTVLATELGIVEPKVFPLSAKLALAAARHGGTDGGLPAFRTRLEQFLLHEKGRVALSSASGAALRLAGEARFLLEVERKALVTPLQELEQKLAEFDRLREQAAQSQRDFQHLLKAETADLIKQLEEELATLKARAAPEIEGALRAFAERHPSLKRRQLTAALEQELRRVLIDQFEAWRGGAEQRLDADLRQLSGRFVAAANGIIERVVRLSATLFDLPPVPLATVEGLDVASQLSYKVGDEPLFYNVEPLYLRHLLPDRITRPLLLANALRQVPVELDRNCGRLRYDFLSRTEASVARFARQLAERIEHVLAGISKAIHAGSAAHARSREQSAARQASIDAHLRRLAAVEEQLRAIGAQTADL
ncbi:MAG: dynamin family protein [Candidatus Binatia bacterium]